MPRITPDDLKYCVKFNQCWDCYTKDKPTLTTEPLPRQQRGNLQVPCCQEHWNDYETKVKQTNALKYARRLARRQQAGRCVYHGCNHKLIPAELLPFRRRGEHTCGQHAKSNPSWLNRGAIIQLIMDHCLTPEQRRIARPQNIIYKRGSELVFVSIQYPNHYTTQIWATRVLKRLYKIQSKRVRESVPSDASA